MRHYQLPGENSLVIDTTAFTLHSNTYKQEGIEVEMTYNAHQLPSSFSTDLFSTKKYIHMTRQGVSLTVAYQGYKLLILD